MNSFVVIGLMMLAIWVLPKEFIYPLGALMIFFSILQYAVSPYGFKRDNTDSSGERSGLTVFVDYKTGVNYVMSPLGGLAIRVDANGKPVTGDPLATHLEKKESK